MKRPPEERFWPKVRVSESCWIWLAAHDRNGYGVFNAGDNDICFAHRFSYELAYGEIPKGLVLDHLCRVTDCVRPDHLEPVTNRENVVDRAPWSIPARNAMKTHCKRGHPFDAGNTYLQPKKWGGESRVCRTCKREALRQFKRRRAGKCRE